ncbi:MAG: MliC family protein [Rhodospirillales bacterium]|nr:MliC family protein [Rhodospirillales bacterium]
MKRLSIVALALLSGCGPQGQAVTATIPRPAPDEATPTGIAYLCDGSKEVSVVYAKNRASVTMADKTWRLEYQAGAQGFRYASSSTEWSGRDDLATLREAAGKPLAFNCRPTRRLA